VIHSFRTVVSDIGANIGYIIAPSGFQSGSVNASEFTNIKLVTWEEFQNEFEETWLCVYFSEA
jgi:restriction system protein